MTACSMFGGVLKAFTLITTIAILPRSMLCSDSEDTHRLILVAYDFITLKKEATLRGDMKGVDHLEKIITAIVEEITRRKSKRIQ